jgi:hypothetical protein
MTTYIIAENLATAQKAARARGIDVIHWLPNKKVSADRLRGVERAHIVLTNVKVKKELLTQLQLIDRGGITFDWVAI